MIPPLTEVVDSIPDSLFEQCVRYAVHHLDILATVDPVTKHLHLKKGLTLPSVICERLLEVYQASGFVCDDKFVTLFENPETTQLRRIKLRNSTITDDGLGILMSSCPTELDIQNCTKITRGSVAHINQKGDRLVSLCIGASIQILPYTEMPELKIRDGEIGYEREAFILHTPNLRKFTARKFFVPNEETYFPTLITPLTKLTHLDLSGCYDLGNLSYLTSLQHLTSLILFNNVSLQGHNALHAIMNLKNLKHLDISQPKVSNGIFRNPNQTLAALVKSLPNLVSLDISGTNLAGPGLYFLQHNAYGLSRVLEMISAIGMADKTMKDGDEITLNDIPGLRSRANNPLEFLGLYRVPHDACKRTNIPAKRISGDSTEQQILTSLQTYMDRVEVLSYVLIDLFHLCRYEECDNVEAALSLLLEAMDRYLNEKLIQTSGSAILCFMAKLMARKPYFKIKIKRQLIRSLVNAMDAFQDDVLVVRNVCLTLTHFNLPEDVLFDYERLVVLLVRAVSEVANEASREGREILRFCVFLLNSLACQVDEAQKQLLGNLGTVDQMLAIILDHVDKGNFDEVVEVAWSTLWNITDETVENCQRFIAGKGMFLFYRCLVKFPGKEELLRNMMGLLGNVAEMKSLRPYLMTEFFVPLFARLLESSCDGIEVSYNAAGVLVHICSDGVESWTVKETKREDVLKKIVTAIGRWNLTTQRNINYRSFQPIFGLLKVDHTEECKYWAVWALANLTTVYRDKYRPLVLKEGGIELLQTVIQTKHNIRAINELAEIVLKNCLENDLDKSEGERR